MKKPTIIIIGTAWPYRGGIAAFNERLAQEFSTKGCRVIIENFKLQYPGFLFPGKSQYVNSPAPPGLTIRRTVNSVNPLNWIRTGNRIRKQQPDLVLVRFWLPFMGPCFGTLARRIKRNRTIPVIAVIDNIIPHEKRIGDRLFTRYFVKPVDAFVTMSQQVLEDTRRFDTKKPRILSPHPLYDHFGEAVPPGMAKKHLQLDLQTHYVMFFGFIREYKGLDLLLKAFAEEPVKQLPVKLLVAGEFYADQKTYLDIVKEYRLENRVVWRSEFIPDDQVRYYFSACDLVVQPYKTATQSGISQIAYHFEKPMIVTRVGGLPEIVPDGKAGYVTERDPWEIAAAIARFYREEKMDSFASGAREEKKKYSWTRLVENILTMWRASR